MRNDGFVKWDLTDGERSVLLAYFAIAIFGAALSFIVVNNLGGGGSVVRKLTPYDLWSIVAGTIGAPIGLYLSRGWLGHHGMRGGLRFVTALLLVAFFGGVAAGTLALPFYGTMFGPFSVLMTFFAHPLLAVFYVSAIFGAHLLFAVWRRERDTLFRMPPDDGLPV